MLCVLILYLCTFNCSWRSTSNTTITLNNLGYVRMYVCGGGCSMYAITIVFWPYGPHQYSAHVHMYIYIYIYVNVITSAKVLLNLRKKPK